MYHHTHNDITTLLNAPEGDHYEFNKGSILINRRLLPSC
jgi:hypothetical protein